MKKTIGLFFLRSVLLIVVVSGCTAPTPVIVRPAATLTPTLPADTPVPSATSTETPTAMPAATIEPPTVATKFLTDVKILRHESFDENSPMYFWENGMGNLRDGVFEMKGQDSWKGMFYSRALIHGNGVIVKFKLQNANGKSGFFFYGGTADQFTFYNTNCQEFAFVVTNGHRPRANLSVDPGAPRENVINIGEDIFSGNLRLNPDTWYNALMAIDKNGEFLAVIWDPNNEDQQAVFHATVRNVFPEKLWFFFIKASEGETIYIDDFNSISFEEIKGPASSIFDYK